MKSLSFLLLFFVLLGTAQAQTRMRSTTEGLSVGIHGHGLGWSSDFFQFLDENAGSGVGGEVRLGYGLNQLYEPFVSYAYTAMPAGPVDAQSFRFSHLDLGLRFNFSATTRRLRPFAEAGYSLVSSRVNEVLLDGGTYGNLAMQGGGIRGALGMQYFVSLPLAITLKAGGTFAGRFRTLTIDDQPTAEKPDFSTFRVSLGLTLFLREL
jgi:hypothetical protein